MDRDRPAHDHVLLMRTLSKFGLAGVRLGYLVGPAALIAEIDKVRPPYNISVLNAEAALFALEHADEFAAPGARCCAASARGCRRALARLPGVQAVPERGQHDPGARARRASGLRRHEGARRAGQERRWHAPVARQLPAPDGRHADENDADDRTRSKRACDDASSTRRTATRAPKSSAQHQGNADPRRASTSTAPARRSSPPASASSTTCSTRSPATA